ncbi:hypothetical protein OHAE_4663 [Ochrobactrum soli]|uniref:Uncharacterized protein n=1 Tax=Ochrobactrum soli TaxID=2448455 RepID=A0A2P9HCT0_9HYPH|nr:hypothetical protein OHAE_4663 [[Ochrobactrum] soli]
MRLGLEPTLPFETKTPVCFTQIGVFIRRPKFIIQVLTK